MACGIFATIVMSAAILGSPELKVAAHGISPREHYCAKHEPMDSNATVTLLDATGKVVLSRSIHLALEESYDSEQAHGGYPAKKVTVLFNYAGTPKTLKAEVVSLEIPSRGFKQSVAIHEIQSSLK